jgi:hypothetical protein
MYGADRSLEERLAADGRHQLFQVLGRLHRRQAVPKVEA